MFNPSRLSLGFALALLAAPFAYAVNFVELEPNDNKAQATLVQLLGVGDTITGNSQSATTTGLDYYTVRTPIQTVAIYRNRLTISQTGFTSSIRGLGQTATGAGGQGPGMANPAATDNALQTSTVASGMLNQWYSFGRQGAISYRVTGTANTTVNYVATFTQTLVTPISLGNFQAGSITFTNTGLSSLQDTEVFIYDSNLVAMPGFTNDDFLDGTVVPPGGSGLNSLLTRNFAPGVYYIAISNFNTADNQLSPADEGAANATFLDFDGAMANGSTTTLAAIPFSIRDANGTTNFTATKAEAFDIYWGTFTVVPEPGTVSLAVIGAAGLAFAAYRRRRKN